MISMQRSLSSPVCVHPPPPASSTATRPPSRSDSHSSETPPDITRAQGLRSRSPARSIRSTRSTRSNKSAHIPEPTASLPLRRSEDSQRDGITQQHTGASAHQKPVIAQPSPPSTPSAVEAPAPPSSSPPPVAAKDEVLSRPPLQPLLTDVSQYTNPHLTVEPEGTTTLEELAHLVRLSKYQERKRANARIRLQRSLISTALSARLTRCGDIAQRNLADCFRSEDKKTFGNLYNAIHDVRNSCDATRRHALLEPDMESFQSPAATSESLESPLAATGSMGSGDTVVPFLNDISAVARGHILDFLTRLRTTPDYLASRLCALTKSELQALTVFHQGLEPIESVLPYHSRSSGRGNTSGANRMPGYTPTAVERLLSFQRHDPLSALIYTCFANSAGPGSAEDKRRTDIWSTACAHLITSKNPPPEDTLVAIMNVWSAMRDWSGRSNMEFFLMKILEDGAFLLDRAEDRNGTRFNLSDWSAKDNIAAEEFYDRAVLNLFELVDDEDATGIPEGAIELGHAIQGRLEARYVHSTRNWFVYKWLFSSWLLAVVVHPESYGMMTEYHITEYARQKILKEVASRASRFVIDLLWPANPHPVSIPPKIKEHVDHIVARFKPSKTQRHARLLPARSITSLRETAEVHPYLVISPADLLTLVNALFPDRDRRPLSSQGSIRSGAPSISGFSAISQPISVGTSRSNNYETASVLSTSASSVVSDATTSHETLLGNQVAGTPQRASPPLPEATSQKRLGNYEEDGHNLRAAMQLMVDTLGADVVAGSCHPCAERWAVLFVSADGQSLSLQMTYDPDDDPEEDNSSTTSETEDDELDEKPELDKDYHQLRDSILRLVEDFEIPQGLEDSGTKTTLSNRASGLKRYRSKNKVITPETTMGSRNPYRTRDEPEPVLITMLKAASSQSSVHSDFVSSHLYWKTLQQLNALTSPSLRRSGFAMLLNIFSRGPRDSIRRSASAIEEYDAWLVWLKQSQERHEGLIEVMMKRLKGLRDKMWYVTDVHNSAPYEHTRSICNALKIMGVPRKWGIYQRHRAQVARGPAHGYIYRNEYQMLDLLAASEEQGGPNKLSDDQAEKTSKWLEQSNIQNLCPGEERIHRFCCEVDSCIGKLVGDSMENGPVLWSSELYSRDRRSLEGPPRNIRDRESSIWSGDDAASIISSSEPERRYGSSSSRPSSLAWDMRSQISFDSGRRSFSRASTAMSDILDAHDYFGVSSPVHTIDSNTTFWSPFHSTMPSVSSATSRAQSPTTSVTNLSSTFSHPYQHPMASHSATRSGTSASSNETIHLKRLSDQKQNFLADLRQTLLTLLLSDLGNSAFARGSETDSWFDELGQECIERRRSQERKIRRPSGKEDRVSKGSPKQRVIEKKKSSGNLRETGDNGTAEPSMEGRGSLSAPSNDSSGMSDTISARKRPSRKDDTPDFPYKKAYERLLKMFSVHPNPYAKLNALFELEHLIEASLSRGGRRSRLTARNQYSPNEESSETGRARTFDQGVGGIRERRPTVYQAPSMTPFPARQTANADARSVAGANPANKDAVARILRSLFRDGSIRPKSLFRDLQFINSFVSPSILDTERSNAFWDIGLAAVDVKKDVITTMIEIADEAIALSRKRPSGGENTSESSRSSATHSLRDAARMLTIAAKEGDATAQREFGIFHLSNPELVERTTLMPLSKPREVFKQTVMEKFGGRPGSSARHPGDRIRAGLGVVTAQTSAVPEPGMESDVRSDPALMCVAIHWMSAAENGGDELARSFLRQNEMMGLS